jgi:gluconate 2-dehydrogenase gamma chain
MAAAERRFDQYQSGALSARPGQCLSRDSLPIQKRYRLVSDEVEMSCCISPILACDIVTICPVRNYNKRADVGSAGNVGAILDSFMSGKNFSGGDVGPLNPTVGSRSVSSARFATNKRGMHRRSLLRAGALVGLSAMADAAEPAAAGSYHDELPWAPHQADAPEPLKSPNLLYFTSAEVRFVDAATERLIPRDELGPGANDVGVTLFIDHQLAGSYGRGARWYMQGPWKKGTPTQGFQSRMTPAELYRAAIKTIDDHVASGGETPRNTSTTSPPSDSRNAKAFADLSPSQQDDLLKEMEDGKLQLAGVDAKVFFTMLLQNTKEGMFSDPIYGGNKDMAGWKMLGFPGARYDYTEWVGKHGVRYTLPPVGIMGRKDWHPQKS